jgi:Holliday junction resolvase
LTSQYRRGANFELEVVHHLRELGYDAQRTAGSKSRVDVMAVHQVEPESLLFIQAKLSGTITKAKKREFAEFCHRAGAVPLIAEKAIIGGRAEIIFTYLED